jgi:RHS repeat-associated protein
MPIDSIPIGLEIAYDPDQQRVKNTFKENGTTTKIKYYTPGYEKDSTTSVTRQIYYINCPYGLVAINIRQKVNGVERDSLYFVDTDHIGSILALIRNNGSQAAEYSYDEWGRRRRPSNWNLYDSIPDLGFIDRGYTGHEHYDQFGLIDMNGRVYDPTIGRFLSPDPVIQSPDYTQNYNSYSYCLNNPLRYSDPSGFSAYSDPWTQQDGKYHSVEEQIAALFNGGQYGDILLWIAQHAGGGQKNEIGKLVHGGNIRFDSVTGKWVYSDEPNKGKEIKLSSTKSKNDNWYYSIIARIIIPDRISISLSANVAVFLGYGKSIELNWLTRGEEASFVPFLTNTVSKRYLGEGDVGIQMNRYWYNGPADEIRKDFVYGPSVDLDAGYLSGGTVYVGLDDTKKQVLWFGVGGGFGGTLGASVGFGDTKDGIGD